MAVLQYLQRKLCRERKGIRSSFDMVGTNRKEQVGPPEGEAEFSWLQDEENDDEVGLICFREC